MKFKVGDVVKLDKLLYCMHHNKYTVNGIIISCMANYDGFFVAINDNFNKAFKLSKLSLNDIDYLKKNYECIPNINKFINDRFMYISSDRLNIIKKVITDTIKCRKNI